ncbi:hypothetical protein BKA70DRAFT_1452040 [Coprinopsis sp. MPI-PUGE-AT-0042]|nr:hypothetical protein BKA70DRAFT_1452040 [Coprinopsis sp. MPI-PUGE-AT-0042]
MPSNNPHVSPVSLSFGEKLAYWKARVMAERRNREAPLIDWPEYDGPANPRENGDDDDDHSSGSLTTPSSDENIDEEPRRSQLVRFAIMFKKEKEKSQLIPLDPLDIDHEGSFYSDSSATSPSNAISADCPAELAGSPNWNVAFLDTDAGKAFCNDIHTVLGEGVDRAYATRGTQLVVLSNQIESAKDQRMLATVASCVHNPMWERGVSFTLTMECNVCKQENRESLQEDGLTEFDGRCPIGGKVHIKGELFHKNHGEDQNLQRDVLLAKQILQDTGRETPPPAPKLAADAASVTSSQASAAEYWKNLEHRGI